MTDDLRAEQNNALLALGKSLDGLAATIRRYGTCAPAALEFLAGRARELATQPAEASSPGPAVDTNLEFWADRLDMLASTNGCGAGTLRHCAQLLRDTHPATHHPDGEVAKLQAFKDYVHGRLDEAGIPADPGGPHSDAGCRIGDRLDIALARAQTVDTTPHHGGDAVDALVEAVGNTAAFLVGYGQEAEFAARKLREALNKYDAALATPANADEF